MALLAGAFPDDWRKDSSVRQLRPGAVIKLCERMDDGNEQEKRFVVLTVTQNTICFVVNSVMNQYVLDRPHIAANHVPMLAGDHSFMSHDSFVDCNEIEEYRTDAVISELKDKPEWMLGTISADLRDKIIETLQLSSTISPIERAPLCAALAAM